MSTTLYRRPAMQTSYGNSGHQLRSMNSATTGNSSNSSSIARGQPLPLASARYRRPSASAYKIERNGYKPDGKPREVIIIDDDEDSPDPSSAANSRASTLTRAAPLPAPSTSNMAPASKRRRANNNSSNAAPAPSSSSSAYYMHNGASSHHAPHADPRSYHHPTESSSRRPAASGVGSKRKAVDSSAPSKQAKKESAVPCDDKEGHYIVRPGDSLRHGRYRIERLLGQGTFGKVVEALDMNTRQWVAVKVIRAVQKYRDASKVEIKVLNLLRERDPHNEHHCIHLVDWFDDRNHICIVTELLSVSVFDFLKDNNYTRFPDAHIQHFAKQLLKSVAFLHDLRLIHTDLKPENILLLDNEFKTVHDKKNPSKTNKVLLNSDIRLIDFGSATFEDEYHASVVSTRHYRAPEIILGLGWSYPCDVWSIGCILVEFFTGEALFQTHDNLEHLAMMEVVFGRMPDDYSRVGSRMKPEWFRNTRLDFPKPDTARQSRKYVKTMKRLDEIVPRTNLNNTRFHDLLSRLLEWDASKRISVKEALKHPFFALNMEGPTDDP